MDDQNGLSLRSSKKLGSLKFLETKVKTPLKQDSSNIFIKSLANVSVLYSANSTIEYTSHTSYEFFNCFYQEKLVRTINTQIANISLGNVLIRCVIIADNFLIRQQILLVLLQHLVREVTSVPAY